MKTRLDPKSELWMSSAEATRVLDALTGGSGEARFVGGAVRNALLRREVKDVDIATSLPPGEVTKRLEAAGIRAVPTGFEHGTITAIVERKNFEITTLRRDTATDGRHATVEYSTDWREDAARRDFTINAYAMRAAASERAGLAKLSGERIRHEMLRLLAAEDPVHALRTMAATGILPEVLPGELSITRLERLAGIDAEAFFQPEPLLRLAAMLPRDLNAVGTVSERWKLSGAQQARLEGIAASKEKIVSYLSVREVRRLLYRLGPRLFKDLVFLCWADDPKASNAVRWRTLLAQADAWQRPRFPLTGRDVMLAGVPEGPLVGRILAEVEEWWVDADFIEDEFSLAERLKAVVQATAY